jgi:CRP-like cAMP-binding protein
VWKIHADRTFLKAGAVPDAVSVLYSGWAFRFRQSPDGRRQILSFLLPSDVLPLESLCFPRLPLQSSIRSLTPISLCRFTPGGMSEILQATPEQRLALEAEMRRQLSGLENRMFDLGRRSALGRLAQLLIELKERLAARGLVKEGRFQFPPKQEHLADALGLTTVYVNRTLVQLRADGIITLERRQMHIRLEDELRRIAEEE